MSLNMAGVGFAFEAQDQGLFRAQTQLISNLNQIQQSVGRINSMSGGDPFGSAMMPGAINQLNTLNASYNMLGTTVGRQIPNQYATLREQMMYTTEESDSLVSSLGGGLRRSAKSGLGAVGKGLNAVGRVFKGLAGGLISGGAKIASSLTGALSSITNKISGPGGLIDSFESFSQGTQSITDPSASGGSLTTGMEAMFTGYAKDAKRFGANMGLVGKDLKAFQGKVVGGADALNISVEDMALAVKAFTGAESEFALVGLKSAKDVAKFQQVTGVAAGDLSKILKQSRDEFGLSEEATSKLVGSFQAFGTASGDIGAGLNAMPATMDQIRKRAAQMGVSLDQADLEKFGTQTAALAAGLYRVTKDSKKAMEVAQAISGGMVQSRQDFGNMFAGLSDDLSGGLQNLGIGFGDISVAFDSMKQGPSEFVAGMAQMVKKAKSMGNVTSESFDFMAKYLGKAVGEDQADELVSFFRNADDATLDLMSSVQKTPADLGKVAKAGFSTGRTLEENFQRSKDFFISGFRSIGRSAAVDFVSETGKQFKTFNKQLQGIAGEGGMLGAVVTKFSEIHQIGALALLPKTLRPMASVFGTMLGELQPAATALKAFGINLTSLLSPSGLFLGAIAGIGGWFASLVMSGKDVGTAFETIGDSIGDFMEALPDKIDKGIHFIEEFVDSLSGGLQTQARKLKWEPIWNRIVDGAKRAFSLVTRAVGDMASGFWDTLAKGVDPDAEGRSGMAKIGGHLAQFAKKAWEFASDIAVNVVWPAITDFATGLWEGFAGTVDPKKDRSGSYKVGTAIASGITTAIDYVIGVLPQVWDAISRFGSSLWEGFSGAGTDAPSGSIEAIGAKIGKFMGDAFDWAVEKFENLVTTNPKAAALIAFAAGGSVAGLAVFAVGETANAMGYVTKTQFADVDTRMHDAMEKSGIGLSKTFTDAFQEAATKSREGAGTMGKLALMVDTSVVEKAMLSKSKAYLNASNDQEKAAAGHRFEQFTADMANLDELTTAYSKTFHINNAKAHDLIIGSIEAGNYELLRSKVVQAGYLQDIQITYQKSASEVATSVEGMSQGWTAFAENAKAKVAEVKGSVKSTYDNVSGTLSKLKGFVLGPEVAKTPEEQTTTFVQKSKIDEKTLQGDMDTIRKATASVAKNLDKPVRKAVEQVLETAFENAYQNINKGTIKFAADQSKLLGQMATDVKNNMIGMWVDILNATAEAVKAIQSDIRATLPMMKSVKAIVDDSRASDRIPDTPEESKRDRALLDGNALLVAAVDWPAWYTEEYRAWAFAMKQAMESLAIAVASGAMKGGVAGSSETAATKLDKLTKQNSNSKGRSPAK